MVVECPECGREFERAHGAATHWGRVHDGPHPFDPTIREEAKRQSRETVKEIQALLSRCR